MSLAQLGLVVDFSQASAAVTVLDKLEAVSGRAERTTEKLAAASVKAAAARRDENTATAAAMRSTLQAVQAEQRLESIRLKAQISAEGRNQSLARAAQLGRDAAAISKQIAVAEAQAAQAQNGYNASLQSYASIAARSLWLQRDMARSAQNSINARLGVNDNFGGAGRAADIEAYGAELDRLRGKFNPLFAAGQQYKATLNEINMAARQGAISEAERQAALARTKAAFTLQVQAMQQYGNAVDIAGRRSGAFGSSLGQLSFQINDIASGLAMGQSPFQILAQQGGQVFQIWQMNNNVFKEAGGLFTRLVTPTRLFTAGILGAAAAMAVLYARSIATEKALDKALIGPGRGAGVTPDQLNAFAVSAASASHIGVGAARDIAQAFAYSGKVSGDNIRELTTLTADYAATTHQSLGDARDELVRVFSDLSSGVETLDKRLAAFSPAQKRYIQNLIDSGRYQEAAAATLKIMKPTLVDHESQLDAIGRAWGRIKAAASSALDITPPTTAALLAKAKTQLAAAQSGSLNITAGGIAIPDSGGYRVQQLKDEVARLAALDAVERRKAQAGAAALRAKEIAKAVSPSIGGLFPGLLGKDVVSERQALATLRDSWDLTVKSTAAQKQLGISLQQATAARDAYSKAVESFLTPAQRAEAQTRIDIQALSAKTPAERAAVAAAQARLNMQGQVITAQEAEAQALAAATTARAAAAYQLDQQTRSLLLNTQGVMAMAEAWNQGSYQVMAAQARMQAANENLQNGVNIQTRASQLLRDALAQKIESARGDVYATEIQAQAQREAAEAVLKGTLAYDRMGDVVQQRVQLMELEALRAGAVKSGYLDLAASIQMVIDKTKAANDNAQQNRDRNAALGLLNPNAQDITNLRTLQGMRQGGEIGQDQFEAARAGTGLRRSAIGVMGEVGSTNPFGQSGQMAVQAAIQQARDEAAERNQIMQDAARAGLITAQEFADARVQIEIDANEKIRQAYTSLSSAQLQIGEQTFGGLADAVGGLVGKQSAAYKALFAVSKAFAIADSIIKIQQGIASALALPFPANIPAIASVVAQGTQIISAIQAVAGFQEGGYTGDAPVNQAVGVVHGQEWVSDAATTRRNRNTLAAMANGASFDKMGFGGRGGMKVEVVHDGSTAVRYEKVSDEHIRIIARDVANDLDAKNVPRLAAASLRTPNGDMAKAARDSLNARRRRQ